MPIYLGHPNNGQTTVSEALTARGIDMLRARPSEITFLTSVEITQPAFQSYWSNLPAFIEAYHKEKRLLIRTEGFLISTPLDTCFPLRLPPLIVDFPRPPPQEQIDVLAGIGYDSITIQNNKTALVFPNITLDSLRTIRNLKPNTLTRTTQNTANLDSMGSIILIWRIFSGFFKTHAYPAFNDYDQAVPYEDFDRKIATEQPAKRKRNETDVGGRAEEEGEMETQSDGGEVLVPATLTERITLHYAKPPPTKEGAPISWGTPAEIPNGCGLLFPFEPHLALSDKILVPNVILDLFFKCLGNSFANCKAAFAKLKSAWGNLYTTEVGDVLSHMARMIQIAGYTQARVFPLFEGDRYVGSVLNGARFTLATMASSYKPVSYADLQEEVGSVKFHSAVLRAISLLVPAGEARNSITTATSFRNLANILKGEQLTEQSRDEIKREAVHLDFNITYLAVNSTTIQKVLNLIGDAGTEIPNDFPMHPSCLFEYDRISTVLSAFGYTAPTFMIPSTPTIKLAKGSDPPKTFACRQVSLASAVADWKAMIEKKSITNNPTNLSKAFKDRGFNGGDKKTIWTGLLSLVNSETVATTDPLGALEKSLNAAVVEEDAFDY